MEGLKCAYNAISIYVVGIMATPIGLQTKSKLSLLSIFVKHILNTLVSMAM